MLQGGVIARQLGADMGVYLAGIIFLWPFRHRNRFLLRVGVCLSVGVLLRLVFSYWNQQLVLPEPLHAVCSNIIWMILLFCILFVQARICIQCPKSMSVYSVAWALVVQQFAHEGWLVLAVVLHVPPQALWWAPVIWFAGVYAVLGVTVAQHMPKRVGPRQLSLAMLMMVISGALYVIAMYLIPNMFIAGVIIILIQCECITTFYLQSVLFERSAIRQELMTLSYIWQQSKAKYSLAKENIDLINRKCHDLKHQMHALKHMEGTEERTQYVSELERSIQIYDAIVKTGNEALDTILTEKSLYCEANHIQVSCVADGSKLDFINPIDLYAIFGNAMDNAIEYVEQIEDSGRRVIDVLVYVKQQFLAICVTNPLDSAVLEFEDGLPITTKDHNGYHGYGLKSIRHTTEKYNGFVTVEAKDGCFSLRVVFPLPA